MRCCSTPRACACAPTCRSAPTCQGGLDSSGISALVKHSDMPLRTFSIRFDDPGEFDESEYQRTRRPVSRHRHASVMCTKADIAASFPA